MRMPGLLLVPLAMVAIVSSAQARPSASVTLADDVRELGAAIEQIHPAPFRSVSRQRFQAEVTALAQRAPSLSRDELLVGLMRMIALLGPRNGHTGLFPGDPGHTRELHFYPLRLYDFADGLYVVDAVDRSLVRSKVVAIEGMPVAQVLERVRAARPPRQRLEPARARAALPPDRGGARRARHRRRGAVGTVHARAPGRAAGGRLARRRARLALRVDVLGRAVRPLPVDPSARRQAALPLRKRQADVGAHARRRARGLPGVQLGAAADARLPALPRAARRRPEGAPRHRRRAAERRRRQHDVRAARRPPRARSR